MNKKTQQIVGVLALVGIGYWAYTQYGKKKSFANLIANPNSAGCPCSRVKFSDMNYNYCAERNTGGGEKICKK